MLGNRDLIQSQFQMSIYYKYAPDGYKIVVLPYVDDCADEEIIWVCLWV